MLKMRPLPFSKLAFVAASALVALAAHALEYRATVDHGVAFYDAPSESAAKLFVTSKGYPVEVLVDNKDWVRVRDQSGALAWVQKKSLTTKRSVMVTTTSAEVHAAPDAKSPLLFKADKNVVFELVDAGKSGWVKVKHRDGVVGYMHIEEVWGL